MTKIRPWTGEANMHRSRIVAAGVLLVFSVFASREAAAGWTSGPTGQDNECDQCGPPVNTPPMTPAQINKMLSGPGDCRYLSNPGTTNSTVKCTVYDAGANTTHPVTLSHINCTGAANALSCFIGPRLGAPKKKAAASSAAAASRPAADQRALEAAKSANAKTLQRLQAASAALSPQ
jgi:hypothetical protein